MADNATSDNLAENQDQGNDKPQYVTKDELVQIVNSAISSRNKSFEKKFDELMAKLTPAEKPEKEEKVANTELLQMKKQLDQIKAERDAEVVKRKDQDLKSNLREQLTKMGVPAHLMKAAMATLSEDKLVGYDEADQLVFKTKDGEMDLANGLKTWSKSEDGKVFLAPKGTVGSGDKKYNSPGQPSQVKGKEDLAALLVDYRLNT